MYRQNRLELQVLSKVRPYIDTRALLARDIHLGNSTHIYSYKIAKSQSWYLENHPFFSY